MAHLAITTQGCSANLNDSEIMAGALRAAGHQLVDTDEAEVVVLNTCSVKGPTESAFWRTLNKYAAQGKRVVVAGCIPQAMLPSERERLKGYVLIGPGQPERIVEAVEAALKGEAFELLDRAISHRIATPRIRTNPYVEIVQVSQGCLSACAFCKTKLARGHQRSTPPGRIVRHISCAIDDGAKEIWLTSQDMSAYGKDIGSSLAALLHEILTIPKPFRLRVGMANPEHCKGQLHALIAAYRDPRIYRFVHVPVQSGSERIVRAMRRDHSVADFIAVVDAFRAAIPEITIATDLICGYPGEREEEFEETLALVERIRPDVINISRFWARPGTRAAQLPQLPGAAIKDRTRRLSALFEQTAHERNRSWVGRRTPVLFSARGKHATILGRTPTYKQVVVKADDRLLGCEREVLIEEATPFDLRGRLI